MLYDGSHHSKKALQLLIQFVVRRLTILHIIELGEYDVVAGGLVRIFVPLQSACCDLYYMCVCVCVCVKGREEIDKITRAEQQLQMLHAAETIAKKQSICDIESIRSDLIVSQKKFGEVVAEYSSDQFSLVVTGSKGAKGLLATALSSSKHDQLLSQLTVPLLVFKITKAKLSFV